MILYYLVYTSVATQPMAKEQLKEILEVARANNHRQRITGLLLYSNGQFLQILEGEKEEVQALYDHIANDERHTHVVTIAEGEADHRMFPDWSMGFGIAAEPEFARLVGYVDSSRSTFLLPRAHNIAPALRDLLLAFVTHPNVL